MHIQSLFSKPKLHRRTPLLVRILAVALVIVFGVSEISYAAPALSTISTASISPSAVKISPLVARVSETHQDNTANKLIIHIQDAHTNISGQQNIAKLIEGLIRDHKLRTVYIEGGTKDDSLSFLRPLASLEKRAQVAKKYLFKGELNGAEYLNLSTDHDMRILGVEDIDLYLESLRTYASVVERREHLLEYLNGVLKQVDALKTDLFPRVVQDFDRSIQDFEQKKISFIDYHKILRETAARSGTDLEVFPNITGLGKLQVLESKVDFVRANQEQDALLGRLAKDADGEDWRALAGQIDKLRRDSLTPTSFYEELLAHAAQQKISNSEFPNLLDYIKYLHAYSQINLPKLLDEFKALEKEIYRKSLTDEDAHYLHEVDLHVRTLLSAVSLQISTADFDAYAARDKEFRFKTLAYLAFINRQLYDLGKFAGVLDYQEALDETRQFVEDFYQATEQRDEIFVQKMLEHMDKDGEAIAVLVTGGYHTPNLTRLFKQAGVSYVVTAPNINETTNIQR